MINILLVDDHIAVAEGTKALLEQDDRFQVSVCSEISVLDKIIEVEHFDVFLFDLYMPEINGIELSKQILQTYPDSRIIIYTGFDINPHFNLIVEAGISGFISKTSSREQIVRTIEGVLRGEAVIPLELFRELRRTQCTSSMMEGDEIINEITLSEREQQILQAIANGLTNKEISQALKYSQRTVEYSLTHIFEKLHVKSRTEALRKARKHHLISLVDIY